MDTSISKLSYVFGCETISHDSLTSREWLRLIYRLLEIQKPYVDYLPFVRNHANAVADVCHITHTRGNLEMVRPKETNYIWSRPASVTESSRLLPLAPMYPWEASRYKDNSEQGWVDGKLTDTYLFYCQGWVKLTRVLTSQKIGERIYDVSVKSSTFADIDDDALLDLVGDRPIRWCMIFDSFQEIMQKAIARKRVHMEHMQGAYDSGAEMRSRISRPLPK